MLLSTRRKKTRKKRVAYPSLKRVSTIVPKKVCHEEFGEGTCIFGQHAEPDRNGFVHHYDVMFEHGVEKGMPITEMKVLEEGSHPDHKKA